MNVTDLSYRPVEQMASDLCEVLRKPVEMHTAGDQFVTRRALETMFSSPQRGIYLRSSKIIIMARFVVTHFVQCGFNLNTHQHKTIWGCPLSLFPAILPDAQIGI